MAEEGAAVATTVGDKEEVKGDEGGEKEGQRVCMDKVCTRKQYHRAQACYF